MSSFNPHNLFLERLSGHKYRKLYFGKQTSVLGRHDTCDLVLMSNIISRRHCEIEFRNSRMYIRNIEISNSRKHNGTFVNRSKITQETELKEGDMIGIGSNPKNLQWNRSKQNILIFKVKMEISEIIEIDSSDEEGHAELDAVHLPSEGDAGPTEDVLEDKLPSEVLQEPGEEFLQEHSTPHQDPTKSIHEHYQEDEISETRPQPRLPPDESADNFPMDESHALPPSPPASPEEPVRRLVPASSLPLTTEGLPIDVIASSLSSDDGSLGLSEARKSLSGTEIDSASAHIRVTTLFGEKRASTLNEARKSLSKKVQSPMDPADEAFEGGHEGDARGDAGLSLNTSCNECSEISTSREGPTLENHQREGLKKSAKGDLYEHASMESTDEQTAVRKSIQLPNVAKRALNPPTLGACEGKQVKPEMKMKRQAEVCIGDEEGIRLITSVKLSGGSTIIDAPQPQPHLSKLASSAKPGTSATTKPVAAYKPSKRRLSVDAPVVTPEERELKEKLVRERKEKLHLIAEEDKKLGAAKEEKERINALKEKLKTVSLKIKNRGDFLKDLPHKPSVPTVKMLKKSSDPKSKHMLLLMKEFLEENEKVKEAAEVHEKTAISNNLASHGAEFVTFNYSEATPPAELSNRIAAPAVYQPNTKDSSVRAQFNIRCESRQPQQDNLKVDIDVLSECHSSLSSISNRVTSNKQLTINRILSWETEWLQWPEACRGQNIERELVAKVGHTYQQAYKNANNSCDILTVKEVSRINFELSELTIVSSTSTLPPNYRIGSLLVLKTHDSESFGYISRLWRGAGEARYITVQTSLDYANPDDVVEVKSRHVCEILSQLKSIIYLEIFCNQVARA